MNHIMLKQNMNETKQNDIKSISQIFLKSFGFPIIWLSHHLAFQLFGFPII